MTRPLTVPLVAPLTVPLRALRAAAAWPVESQRHARRNALVASTELTARIHDQHQVEQFLEHHRRRWQADRLPTVGHAPAQDTGHRLRAAL